MQGICAIKSAIRMAVLMKPGKKNITWYSWLRYNNRDEDFIIKKMINGLTKHLNQEMDDVQVIQFYNNQNNVKIKEFKDGDPLP